MSPLRLAVVGASGRMGRAVVRLATEGGDRIVCAVAAKNAGRDAGELAGIGSVGVTVTSDVREITRAGADVIVDFSTPAAFRDAAGVAARAKTALVSGTTGLGSEETLALREASDSAAILWEPNMSVGVEVLAGLVRDAVKRLGLTFDVEVVESHHRLKVDAPSGTALRLAEVARAARADSATLAHGREGRTGARPGPEIGVHAVRGGDVIGDHTVHLLGQGERLELTHRATSRDLFARGALLGARWIVGKPAGRYTLRDVLSGP